MFQEKRSGNIGNKVIKRLESIPLCKHQETENSALVICEEQLIVRKMRNVKNDGNVFQV